MGGVALLIVDVQYDFLPGGALAVPNGEEIIPVINNLINSHDWKCIVATQDYHPAGHISFASTHDKDPFTEIPVTWEGKTQQQTLWPDHCIQNTKGCELHSSLDQSKIQKVIRKGYNKRLDSYSAFADSFEHEETGLDAYFKKQDIEQVYVVGLALDFCVYATALAASKLRYRTFIVQEACRGIKSMPARNSSNLQDAGVIMVDLEAVCT